MYNLEVPIRITKELLLTNHTQEDFFEHYLGVPVKKGLFCSPTIIRKDNKPTCSFYKGSNGLLKYKDFAGPTFDFVGAVMYIYDCSYYTALRTIANDFGIIQLENVQKNEPKMQYSGYELKETEKAKIQVEIQEFSQKELDWWASFGISLKTLNKFKVFSIKSVFLNGNYFTSSSASSPIYGYYGGETSDGDELWRLYMPTKLKYRFLSNWNATMIQGAKQLPKSGEFIVITKSLKDVMALYEFGIIAIAPNSENLFVTDAQYAKLKQKFKDIYLLYDLDGPGIKSSKKIKKDFPNISVLFIPRKFRCKDFTDFVKKYNTDKVFNLIEDFKNYYLCQKQ